MRSRLHDIKIDIVALYLARRDRRIPLRSRLFIALAVGYLLSPVDLIPDFIPVLGQLDDLVVVPVLVGYAVKCVPDDVMTRYRKMAEERNGEGVQKAWLTGAAIVTAWIVIIWGLLFWLWK